MAKTQSDSEVVSGEVFGPAPPQPGRRRYYTLEEKRRLLDEARAPGSGISTVARKYGVSASQLFRWRRLAEAGALEAIGANEAVVPESEVKQLRGQIRELQRLLGKKTLENEILKEALELVRSKKLSAVDRGLQRDASAQGAEDALAAAIPGFATSWRVVLISTRSPVRFHRGNSSKWVVQSYK